MGELIAIDVGKVHSGHAVHRLRRDGGHLSQTIAGGQTLNRATNMFKAAVHGVSCVSCGGTCCVVCRGGRTSTFAKNSGGTVDVCGRNIISEEVFVSIIFISYVSGSTLPNQIPQLSSPVPCTHCPPSESFSMWSAHCSSMVQP